MRLNVEDGFLAVMELKGFSVGKLQYGDCGKMSDKTYHHPRSVMEDDPAEAKTSVLSMTL